MNFQKTKEYTHKISEGAEGGVVCLEGCVTTGPLVNNCPSILGPSVVVMPSGQRVFAFKRNDANCGGASVVSYLTKNLSKSGVFAFNL